MLHILQKKLKKDASLLLTVTPFEERKLLHSLYFFSYLDIWKKL